MSSISTVARSGLVTRSPLARFQAWAFQHRNLLAALPVIFAFFVARISVGLAGVAAAASLMLLGAALRAWCTLYNRFAQGEHKTLATQGPYACVRNPLYVGNALVLSGCALATGLPWLLPITWLWAFLVYDQVVRHEERRLLEKHGETYRDYRERVARWTPRIARDVFVLPRAGLLPTLLVQSRAVLLLLLFVAKSWALNHWPAA